MKKLYKCSLAGVGAPEHLFPEGGKEIAFGGLDYAYFEGGAAYFYGCVLRTAETVAVN